MSSMIRYTIKELARRRVAQVTFLTALLFLAVFWYLINQVPRQSVMVNPLNNVTAAGIALVLGLFFCYFIVAFFAVLTTTGSLSGEIDSGLLLVLMARPVRRSEVLVGKWIGIAVVQTVMVSLVVGGVLAILQITHPGLLIWGLGTVGIWGCFVLQAWVLSALTLLCSVGLSAVASGILMTMAFLTAFVSGSLSQLPHVPGALHSGLGTLRSADIITNLLLPSDGLYRRAVYNALGPAQGLFGSYLGPFGVAQVPNNLFIVYTVVYLIAILLLAAWWFRKRDL